MAEGTGSSSEMLRRQVENHDEFIDEWKETWKEEKRDLWEAINELRKILTEHRISTARTTAMINGAGVVINALVIYLVTRG